MCNVNTCVKRINLYVFVIYIKVLSSNITVTKINPFFLTTPTRPPSPVAPPDTCLHLLLFQRSKDWENPGEEIWSSEPEGSRVSGVSASQSFSTFVPSCLHESTGAGGTRRQGERGRRVRRDESVRSVHPGRGSRTGKDVEV